MVRKRAYVTLALGEKSSLGVSILKLALLTKTKICTNIKC